MKLYLIAVGTDCKLPRGYVEYPEDRTAYRFHREKLTWELARERCFSEDADLAVVTSRQKMMHILNHLQIPSNSALFIGVHRLTPSSDWVRADTGEFRPVRYVAQYRIFLNGNFRTLIRSSRDVYTMD